MEESSPLVTPGLSRRGLFKGSLIVGLGAAGLSVASTAVTAGVARASETADIYLTADYGAGGNTHVQTQWGYCVQCRNLFYTAKAGGACCYDISSPGYGNFPHIAGTSPTNYGVMIDNDPGFDLNENPPSGYHAYLQSPWRFCSQCHCLFWGPEQSQSWCAYNYKYQNYQTYHSDSGSGVYYMPSGVNPHTGADAWTVSAAVGQPGWKYCNLCKCLYWGSAAAESWCQWQMQNALVNPNHAAGSTVYTVFMMP
jgi:hypothetical protein